MLIARDDRAFGIQVRYDVCVKLSNWTRQNGITYKSAWEWWKAGKLAVPPSQLPTETIQVEAAERERTGAVLCA